MKPRDNWKELEKMKLNTFELLREAHALRGRVFFSPRTRVYCAFVGGNWSFTREDPIVAGALKNCPAPFADDWDVLVRKEPQRGDVHPSCESCDHSMRYGNGNTVVCTNPLVSTDGLHPARIPRPALSYCSNHTALKTCEAKVVDEPGELTHSNGTKTTVDGKPVVAGLVSKFEDELARLINCHSIENESNTPDFALAKFLNGCLRAFNDAVRDETATDAEASRLIVERRN